MCYDVFKTMYAQGLWKSIVNGYFYRLYGFFTAIRHIGGYTTRPRDLLHRSDREGMTPDQLRESRAQEKVAQSAINAAMLTNLIKVLSPFYDPRKKKMPANMRELLQRYAQPSRATPSEV